MLNHVQGEVWKRVWILWGQVWKRVREMAFFGLKFGLDFEIRGAHPHQKFQRVPPPPGLLWPILDHKYYNWITRGWKTFTFCPLRQETDPEKESQDWLTLNLNELYFELYIL